MIDDDLAFGQLVRDMLSVTHCEFTMTSDYREGLQIALSQVPDLILLDVHMPEVSGLDIIRQLRKMQATRQIPVIMLTGDDSMESVKQAKQEQAVGYILKPFKPRFLIQSISDALGENIMSTLKSETLDPILKAATQKTRAKTKTLLAIDDEPIIFRLLEDILADSIFNLISSSDPREGLRLAMTHSVDLILMDFNMPDISGLELTEQLKKMRGTHNIPIIVMSGMDEDTLAERSKTLGATAFLAKPFRPLQLVRALQQALGKDVF